MPKTKKPAKRKGLSTIISLSSTKGKLILFLLIFAVVGGGYMLYSSFAATSEDVHYANKITKDYGSPYTVTESSGNKGGVTVWKLTGNQAVKSVWPTYGYNKFFSYKYCFTYRVQQSGSAPVKVYFTTGSNNYTGDFQVIPSIDAYTSSTYKQHCTSVNDYKLTLNATNNITPSVSIYGPGTLYVSNMSLKDYSFGSYPMGPPALTR